MRSAAEAALRILSVGSLAFLVFVGVGPRTGAYRTLTVLSGSMSPTFDRGAMLVVVPVAPEDVEVGDVITYNSPVGSREVVSHRVVDLLEPGPQPVVRTKGDANEAPDAWTAQLTSRPVWRMAWSVPFVGRAIGLLRHPMIRQASVTVAPALLAVLWLRQIWTRRPEGDEPVVWEWAVPHGA